MLKLLLSFLGFLLMVVVGILLDSLFYEDLDNYQGNASVVLVFSKADENKKMVKELIGKLSMKELCVSYPRFMEPFLDVYGYKTERMLIVYGAKLKN